MRDYLFRGKTPQKDDSEFDNIWVFGDLIQNRDKFYIHPKANSFKVNGELSSLLILHEVIPETVGQYTGLAANGKKIFEGDILEGLCGLHKVYFDEGFACFDWKNTSGKQSESFSGFADEYKIIGNIQDNPELLKGGV